MAPRLCRKRGQVYQEFIIVFALWLMVCVGLYFYYAEAMDGAGKNAELGAYRKTATALAALSDYSRMLRNSQYAVVLGGSSNVSRTGPAITAQQRFNLGGGNVVSASAKTACNFSHFANASAGTVRFKSVSGTCYSR